MQIGLEVLVYMAGFTLLLLLLHLFRKPLLFALRLLWRTAIGGVLLMLINTLPSAWGICLAVNPISVLITGFLGLPGVAALHFITRLV